MKYKRAISKTRLPREQIFKSADLSADLKKKSVHGGIISIFAQGCQFVLNMARTIILARLLTPNDFGLIGMVMVFVRFAGMFKDAGLSMATVQKEKISASQISTLFWINVVISGIIMIAVLAISPLVALYYERPELTSITAVLSASIILEGVSIQHAALLRRHMKFSALALTRIASQSIAVLVSILMALLGWRYWALVGSSLASAFSASIFTFAFCPWVPGFAKKRTEVREMLNFGLNLTGFNFANYFARNADNLLIGRYLGAEALGFYSKAYNLLVLPTRQIRAPLMSVAVPAMSAIKNDPLRYKQYYQSLLDILATAAVPLMMYCTIEANFLVSFLLGSQWNPVVPIFRVLSFAGLFESIAGTRGLVLISSGHGKRIFRWGIINSIISVISFIVGLPYGAIGVAYAYSASCLLILVPSLYYCFRFTPIKVSTFFNSLRWPIIYSFISGIFLFRIVSFPKCNATAMWHITAGLIYWLIYILITIKRPKIKQMINTMKKKHLPKTIVG